MAQRAIMVTADAESRIYGDDNPALTYQLTSGNFVNGDSLSGALTTTATASSDIGTYGIGQGTLANGNYAISYVGADLSVTPRAITVTANAGQSKIYGDSDPLSYGYAFSDLGGGTTLVGSLDRAAGENVGTYAIGRGSLSDAANGNYDITYVGAGFSIGKRAVTVTATGGQGVGSLDRATGEDVGTYAIGQGTLTNASNSNYDINYVDANFSIGKRAVTVTASTGQGKTYGDSDPLSYGYTVSDLGNGVDLVGSLDRVTGEDVGTYAIGQGTLTNASNSNYDVSYVGANFSIGKRAVTVMANSGQGKTYGDSDPLSYGYTVSDLGSGVDLVGSLNRVAGENVGTYAIGQDSLETSNANYDITYVGANFAIGKRAVTVTAITGQGKIYGDSDPLSYGYTVSDLGSGVDLVGALDRASGENVGNYAIGQGSITDVANSNYDISYVGADFSVGKRSVTVTAGAGQGKTYGNADPSSYGYTFTDLGNGVALVGTLDRIAGETVGNYAIGQGTLTNAANSNYDISYAGADFGIGKRSVTVTANSGQGKIYGDADPSSYGYTSTDLGNGVALVGTLDRAAGENAGAYAIGQGTLTDSANSNYDISYIETDFSIGKRAITVMADPQSRPQGMPNPPLTYSIGGLGLVNGDTFLGTLSTEATPVNAPGNYAIEQGSLTLSANYELTYVGADLVVSAPNTVPATEAASTVAYNTNMRGGGWPTPVFFTGVPADGDAQTLVEDPRVDGPAFCQGVAGVASVCAVASVQ
ncbi:MBG domain-containing protein [Mesorhizobium cantuariense]|uniref:MBG domain-containing protein n=1 Tax=Mesorhizobium cantuariense TaxID=1300275 RepID=A0ABV7MTB5_9HYPH